MRLRIAPLLFLLLAVAATACASDATVIDTGNVDGSTPPTTGESTDPEPTDPEAAPEGVAAELAAARERWLAAGITDYVLTWSPSCFCPMATFTDTVNGGTVVAHEVEGEVFWETEGTTMEALFDEIERALADDPFRIDAEFDATTGAVVSYFVDLDEMIADEEHGVVVTSVVPITSTLPGGPAVVSGSDLTVDHPCGHGFAKGSADQTISLVIFHTGEWTEDGPSLDEPIELGSNSEWSARISVGADLFANWCDDVVEEDEPTPRIDREFTITQGTLVGEVDGSVARASLSNVVAAPVDGPGEPIELPEIQLVNEGWGFFAG